MSQRGAGFPETLLDFQRMFPNEQACAAYLERLRWPTGFSCRRCSRGGEPFRFPKRSSVVLRCRGCGCDTSLAAGTVMERTRMPLAIWFWGAYLVTSQTPGISALQFQRQLGIGRYETAFQMLHKLRAAMVRPDRDRIGGDRPVEVDEAYVSVGKRDAIVAGAVEVRRAKAGKRGRGAGGTLPKKGALYAGRLRLRHVSDRGKKALQAFVTQSVEPWTLVTTDGWQGYDKLKALGYDHEQLTLGSDPIATQLALPMIHIVFSNLKCWLLGTHHGVSEQHLQAYLNEFVFRFNRRFYPFNSFNSVLGIAVQTQGPTYDELYAGQWKHPVAAGGARP
jgi:transposase-like protein